MEPNGVIEAQLTQIAEDVAEIKEIISGNGDPSKGMIVRLDRLEQADSRRSWLTRTAVATSLAALASVIVAAIAFVWSH